MSNELIAFMTYLEESTDESIGNGATDNIKLLHKKVKQVKQNANLEAKYMTGEDLLRCSKCDIHRRFYQ